MKKTILFLMMLLPSIVQISAQQKGPHISFEQTAHDFGKIFEEDGDVTIKFVFSNTGTEPVIIQQVSASCGCTTPEWTKTPVNPGKKGFVAATYSPKDRPGEFSKTISVTTNAELQSIVLRIKGEVLKKDDDMISTYPAIFGKMRSIAEFSAFGELKNTETKVKYIDIYNPTDAPMKIEAIELPSHISIQIVPQILEPKGKAKMGISYNAGKKNAWDYALDRFMLKINGELIDKPFTVSATIVEDFSKLSEKDLAKAPKITFKEKTFDFGTIKQGDKVEFEFEFTNEGKSDLVIRKTHASCGCTAINMAEKEIKSAKTGKIKAVFNSEGKVGKQTKTITIITNDPKNSKVVLWIKGDVVQ